MTVKEFLQKKNSAENGRYDKWYMREHNKIIRDGNGHNGEKLNLSE